MTIFARRASLAWIGIATGCSVVASPTGQPSRTPAELGTEDASWTREIDPFQVLDSVGVPYQMPFLGGFNVPRPQLVDIDGDGDQDLFVQETSDRLLFFEREVSFQGATYRWRPELFNDLPIGEWYRFVDVDSDGDRDLLAEEPFSYVRLYRNVGTAGTPRFELAADTLRDERGDPIFSDRQNIPNAADIDCDGRLDLLLGRLVGTVTRYEALETIGSTGASFQHVTDRFEDIEIVGSPDGTPSGIAPARPLGPVGAGPLPLPGGVPSARHGANTMALADVDSDGDIDFFWGDFFEPGLLFIENVGSCADPDLGPNPIPFPPQSPVRTSGYNAPTFGDVDGDGDLDLLIGVLGGAYNPNTTTTENLLHLSQNSDGSFELRTRRFLSQIDVGSESVPNLVDLDGDGDLDLLLGNRIDPVDLATSHVYRFENVGTPTAPIFEDVGRLALDGDFHNAPAFGDLDGDGDLDVILGTWMADVRYLQNIGSLSAPRFELVDPSFLRLPRGSNGTPTLGDLDGDGDLDLLIGESSGTVNFFENVGDPSTPLFRLQSEDYLSVDVGRRSFPLLADVDHDDDLDLLVGTEGNGIAYYENRGGVSDPAFTEVESPFPSSQELPRLSAPALGDVDGDGDDDLVVGGMGGGVYYFENTSP